MQLFHEIYLYDQSFYANRCLGNISRTTDATFLHGANSVAVKPIF